MPQAYIVTTNHTDYFSGVDSMYAEILNDEVAVVSTPRNRTLQTLLQVICAEEEFSVLQETLRLYCEEICKE
jgi:hypothetical protein